MSKKNTKKEEELFEEDGFEDEEEYDDDILDDDIEEEEEEEDEYVCDDEEEIDEKEDLQFKKIDFMDAINEDEVLNVLDDLINEEEEEDDDEVVESDDEEEIRLKLKKLNEPTECLIKKTFNVMSKYEKNFVVGCRIQQIANGSPILIDIETMDEKTPLAIAMEELRLKKIPFKIKRMMPNNTYELWDIEDLIIY